MIARPAGPWVAVTTAWPNPWIMHAATSRTQIFVVDDEHGVAGDRVLIALHGYGANQHELTGHGCFAHDPSIVAL